MQIAAFKGNGIVGSSLPCHDINRYTTTYVDRQARVGIQQVSQFFLFKRVKND